MNIENLKKIPDLSGAEFPERVSFACNREMKNILNKLKLDHRKDISEFCRINVEKALKELGVFPENEKLV